MTRGVRLTMGGLLLATVLAVAPPAAGDRTNPAKGTVQPGEKLTFGGALGAAEFDVRLDARANCNSPSGGPVGYSSSMKVFGLPVAEQSHPSSNGSGGFFFTFAVPANTAPGTSFAVDVYVIGTCGVLSAYSATAHWEFTVASGKPSTTTTTAPQIAPSDGSAACRAKKNFWGWDGPARAWWRKVYEEAHKRAHVAKDWADFFDLFHWISKLPGMNDPKLERALDDIDTAATGVEALEKSVRFAGTQADKARGAVADVKADIAATNRSINRLSQGARNPTRQAQLLQLKNQQRALQGQLKTAEAGLAEQLKTYSSLNRQMKSKAIDPLIDKLLGATEGPLKTALRGLDKTLGVMNAGQSAAAGGVFAFGALAGIAKAASKPPKGCAA